MSRLRKLYNESIITELKNRFGYKNIELVPKIEKITVNVGSGEMQTNKQYADDIVTDIKLITGQTPIVTKAKKAISAFKLREGNVVGATVTLRKDRMYDFLDKLVSITIPRLRDFRGLSLKSFDGHGNYSFGFKEQSVFSEIPYENIHRSHGIQITIQTSAKNNAEGKALLECFGVPFVKEAVKEQ